MKTIKTIKGYYVYGHKNTQNEIVYVGKGKTYRAFTEAGRGDKHKEFMLSDEFEEVVIFKEGLTEDEAFYLEAELIGKHKPVLNLTHNSNRSKRPKVPRAPKEGNTSVLHKIEQIKNHLISNQKLGEKAFQALCGVSMSASTWAKKNKDVLYKKGVFYRRGFRDYV